MEFKKFYELEKYAGNPNLPIGTIMKIDTVIEKNKDTCEIVKKYKKWNIIKCTNSYHNSTLQ